MEKRFTISRQIEIDSGHRVTYHGSKCRNLHGHRYKIIATCSGPLFEEGEQQGMVLDFGFLKDEMLKVIHDFCDHALILWSKDPLVPIMINDTKVNSKDIDTALNQDGYFFTMDSQGGALYIINNVPTAETLAKHWFDRLTPLIKNRSNGQAELTFIEVHETPNCIATYPA